MEPPVVDNPEKHRYELRLEDGRMAGWIEYERTGDVLALTHTFVKPELRNQGFGERLVRETLDDVRTRGLAVEPVCPFVVAYVRRHPEAIERSDR